jgi:hypothetical protein
MEYTKNTFKKKVWSEQYIYQKRKKINKIMLEPEELEKSEKIKPKVSKKRVRKIAENVMKWRIEIQ